MTSEACPVCGEEIDAAELGLHGHFGSHEEDGAAEFRGDSTVAEADLRRVSDALLQAENNLADAEARSEAIEQETFDGGSEAEAEISQRMEIVQREIESFRQEVAEAEDELHRTHDHWVQQGYLPA